MAAAHPETHVPPTTNGLGYTTSTTATGFTAAPTSAAKTKGPDDLEIKLEFGGGLHLIFAQQPRHTVYLPRLSAEGNPADIRFLIKWMKENLVTEREDMFVDGEGV